MSVFVCIGKDAGLKSEHIESVAINELDKTALNGIGYIIQAEAPDALASLTKIRQHDNPNIYLRPVIYVHDGDNENSEMKEKFDLSIAKTELNDSRLLELQNQFANVNQWISTIPNNDNGLSDVSLRFRVLRLLASRNKKCTPRATIHYSGGFEYSFLTPLFSASDGSIEQVLSFLHSQQLLKDEFLRKAHFCPNCDSAFLNFKETCPDCGSDNIEKDELIHHFKCGHTDVVSAFEKENGRHLQCPKCEEELRHIGVDYDKPSTVSTCMSCSHSFQDAAVKADCFSCHRTSDVEDLVLRTVSSYVVTAIGANAARYGLDALFTSILQSDLKLYSVGELKQFLVVEQSRIERYKKSETSLAIIHFANLESLFNNLGRKTEQVFKELSAVFKSVFRESDLITASNESLFAVIMTETSVSSAKLAIDRLEQAITELFEESLDFDLDVRSQLINIMDVENFERSIESFIENMD